ncbi:MAG TPA: type I-E CRISPR-associated protein Cas6/Cse3/CasE [Candidatus Omnitrophica bacterium]|nr:MAG: type I-E CRISPR-associated protein Cas6/Cse3/CasE [Omnitrophica WOR_2 bacterium GWA2_45_18]OGX20271.1 MAG: type I-E CRISPR-associated protein Cas6/Cse3/CasE [Omnitrophica WOR_2 bacterium GWC2_45_7]HBR14937.1 type I-E CRISPR-associated protein Cas6/Cse3/CasE [Candidatus Omnitrophota bacterium]
MLLHKLHLNLRCKEVRRDVANPYEMHSTLCRAFCAEEQKCPPALFLWRLEPETRPDGTPRALIQSQALPDWSRIAIDDWFAEEPASPIDIKQRLRLDPDFLLKGIRFRYRLRANPSVRRNGKRIGLYKPEEQDAWLVRQGQRNGFIPETIHRSQEKMLDGKRRSGEPIRVFSVLYDGILKVMEPGPFIKAVTCGIGHGKAMGLGMLSIVPI